METPLVLVVDNDETMCELLTDVLAPRYRVRTALDALEATDLLLSELVALLVIELDLPVLTGAEFIQILRSHAEFAHLPILGMSSYLDPSYPVAFMQGILLKPFALSELADTMNAAIQPASESGLPRAAGGKGARDSLPSPPWDVLRNADGGRLSHDALKAWMRALTLQSQAMYISYERHCALVREMRGHL